MKQSDNPKEIVESKEEELEGEVAEKPSSSSRLPILLILLVFIAVVSGAGYKGWLMFNGLQQSSQNKIQELKAEVSQLASRDELDNRLQSLQQSISRGDSHFSKLSKEQSGLRDSVENLYELYGRDENGWKLAEVEYLMSIAQHKLVLENDFEGAAKTLLAASEQIADLADPGLLVVRVKINEEIALLKTRSRPDLVGMTLLVSRLGRQITFLKPGFQSVSSSVNKSKNDKDMAVEKGLLSKSESSWQQEVESFVTSLVHIKTNHSQSVGSEQVIAIDVGEKLEDNLKLTRWSLLERDAFQYERLMSENIQLFKEYYDLNQAVNNDFYQSLLKLGQAELKPDLPDISTSLSLLKKIQHQRQNTPQQGAENG